MATVLNARPPRARSLPEAPAGADGTPPIVLVSHRGPVMIDATNATGRLSRANGGLVTALRDLVRHAPDASWVCAATTDTERTLAAGGSAVTVPIAPGVECDIHLVAVDPDAHHQFYAVIANPMLWFVQHMLWDLACTPNITAHELAAWRDGYVRVNEAFAARAAEVARVSAPDAVVMIHDYHFYLVPGLMRAAGVDRFLHCFVHIPWPNPEAWRVLPIDWRHAIVRGLLGADVVAFHTGRYARNFMLTCQDLLGVEVDESRNTVRWEGRDVAVRFYPISVDPESLLELASTSEAESHEAALEASRPRHLILRVDRTDPAKNILRGFLAYDRLLELHPELHGEVTFLALLQPSRQDVREYAQYCAAVEALARDINARRGDGAWQPIDLRLEENLPLAVAAYRQFDVLIVNAVADGMNLVAKEALIVNQRDGVLALSEATGAHEELGAVALTLAPFDIEQQAQALWDAITMPADERAKRHDAGVDIVRTNNVDKWLGHQLADIHQLQAARV
jgi:trehalose 6-phosphate synthase